MGVSLMSFMFAMCLAAAVQIGEGSSIVELNAEVNVEYLKRMAPVQANLTGSRTCYGDVNKLRPSGMAGTGVPGSRANARLDVPELKKRWNFYQYVADKNCIQASLIAALASRESRGGALLYRTGGWGDHHRAWGILQCDIKHSGLNCLSCFWDSECHIQMMVSQLLVPYIRQVRRSQPSWSIDQALQGGVAAYNCGPGRIGRVTWPNVDIYTTGHDYSNDVIARAQYLYEQGWN